MYMRMKAIIGAMAVAAVMMAGAPEMRAQGSAVGRSGASAKAIKAVNFDKYAAENAALPPLRKGEKRVVFLGSSITEGWQTEHPEFFKSNGYLGRGISGQSTYALLLRFRPDVIDLNPTCVVIGAGEPDIAAGDDAYSEDRTFANIVSMCELARMHGIKVVLTSVLPAEGYYWNQGATGIPDKIESLNRRIKAYAQANRLAYADYYTPLVHPGDRAIAVTFSDDGVHPNRFGYTIMEPIISAILKKM